MLDKLTTLQQHLRMPDLALVSSQNWSEASRFGTARLYLLSGVDTNQFHRCTVFALVRLPESSVGGRFAEIYALDDTLTDWWSALQPGFKLAPAALPNMPTHQLSHTLLLNAVYHQCMCALHASVVPLFSWTPSESSWTSARQASAQKAYEHASAVSNLITATLTSHPQLAITHSFLAYAAYSGCAVQVPFMWSSNPVIKKQATVNVSKNVRMIQSMTPYWKFATLVVRPRPYQLSTKFTNAYSLAKTI